ncbi:actin-related protein 6 [Coccinella septempunctata]|uniref:actin-related protein 6 n=1 Tax=Coccinella septempunctata TaxID=41139 RepID=UPI001D06FAE7|nr:actin-related protein 6 [Coccinella septempunctata]
MNESIEYDINDVKRFRDNKGHGYGRRLERQRIKRKHDRPEDLAFMEESKTVVMDSGAYTIKAELACRNEPIYIPNCIMKAKAERKRLFIGNQIDECRDCSGLFYLLPCERGYITKWEVQKPIWDHVFNKAIGPLNDKNILMTQPLFNFKNIQDCMDEIFFEEYEIASMYRCNPSDLVALKYGQELGKRRGTCIVVDSGYSFTHVVPYINGLKCSNAIRRLHIGGKMLTNHMKDILSYRQYHVMEETYVINQVKEDTCFVSEDFKTDLRIASEPFPKNHIVRNYILPDFNTIRRGYIQDPYRKDELHENCQVLKLNNERFAVPEILFTPSDIGITSVGLVDCIIDSIKLCPKKYHEILAKNIVLVGGNALLPGIKNRIIKEFQSKMPTNWNLGITVPAKSTMYAWQGGKSFLKQAGCNNFFATKKEYEEMGSSAIQKKFNQWTIFKEEERKVTSEIKPISLIDHVNKLNVFNKNGDPEDYEQSDFQKIFTNDSTCSLNKSPFLEESGSAPSFGIFDEKNSVVLTPPSSEKSSEISVGSEYIYKLKSNPVECPKVKYFFDNEDSVEESQLLL